jgi:hypothetical protein
MIARRYAVTVTTNRGIVVAQTMFRTRRKAQAAIDDMAGLYQLVNLTARVVDIRAERATKGADL